MTNEQLAVLLRTKCSQLQSIYRDLYAKLEPTHTEKRKGFMGEYECIPVMDDFDAYLGELETDIKRLLVEVES